MVGMEFLKKTNFKLEMELKNKIIFGAKIKTDIKSSFGHNYYIKNNLYLEIGRKIKLNNEIQYFFYSHDINDFKFFDDNIIVFRQII